MVKVSPRGHLLIYGIRFLSTSLSVVSLVLSNSLEITLINLWARNLKTLLTYHYHIFWWLCPLCGQEEIGQKESKSMKGSPVLLRPKLLQSGKKFLLLEGFRGLLFWVLLLLRLADSFSFLDSQSWASSGATPVLINALVSVSSKSWLELLEKNLLTVHQYFEFWSAFLIYLLHFHIFKELFLVFSPNFMTAFISQRQSDECLVLITWNKNLVWFAFIFWT